MKSKCDGCVYWWFRSSGSGVGFRMCIYAAEKGETRTKMIDGVVIPPPPPGKGTCPYYKKGRGLKRSKNSYLF